MKEVLFTSSVLIAALLLLRWLFRNSIPRRVQYALWGLVLARLLLPVSLPAIGFSVLTAAEPMGRQIGSQALYIEPIRESVTAPDSTPVQERTPSDYQRIALDRATQDNTRVFTDQKDVTHTVQYARQISLEAFLYSVWLAGMSGMAVWLLVSNLRFWRKLCKVRRFQISSLLGGCWAALPLLVWPAAPRHLCDAGGSCLAGEPAVCAGP